MEDQNEDSEQETVSVTEECLQKNLIVIINGFTEPQLTT